MITTLITGANRGIGLELARQLSARGEHVIACCRTASDALKTLDLRVEEGVDVGDSASLAALDERLGDAGLDRIFNNAGVLHRDGLDTLDEVGIRQQFEINALGPLRVVSTLVHRVPAGGKIAVVTSRMGSMADNTSGGAYGYRMSKAAVNAAFKSLAVDLAPRNIAVAILHPGWVRTEMTGRTGLVDASESAAGLVARVDALTQESSGTFWHMNGETLPW